MQQRMQAQMQLNMQQQMQQRQQQMVAMQQASRIQPGTMVVKLLSFSEALSATVSRIFLVEHTCPY